MKEVCHKHGIISACHYQCKSKYGGFDASEFAGLTINYVSEPRFYGVDFSVKW